MEKNGSSRIDYVLVSETVLDMFTFFCIGDPNIFSDHCVVSFSLLSNITQVDSCIDQFVAVIDGDCTPLFEKKISPIRQSISETKYDESCELNRLIFIEKLNKFKKIKLKITELCLSMLVLCIKSP